MDKQQKTPWYEKLLLHENEPRLVLGFIVFMAVSFSVLLSSKLLNERQTTSNRASEITAGAIPTPIRISQTHNKNIVLKVNQEIEIILNRTIQDSYQDFVSTSTDTRIIQLINDKVNNSLWTAVYKAKQKGKATLSVTGRPICINETPSCNYPISTFDIFVTVE